MSHQSLRAYLDASREPHPSTILKLRNWHVRTAAAAHQVATVDAALAILLDSYPQGEREPVRRKVLETMLDEHRRIGGEPPDWMLLGF
jgi:hypothetical protein